MQEVDRRRLGELIDTDSAAEIVINVHDQTVSCADEIFDVSIKESAREAFLAGTFDPLATLLASMDRIQATARRLGYAD